MQDPRILENWKAIASYLGRSVRACARWEAEYGLPVHRLDGSSKARVFAYKDEIDRWLEERLHEHEKEGSGLEKPIPSRLSSLKITPIRIPALALSIFALAIAGVLLWTAIFQPRNRLLPSAAGRPVLAVLDFENKSGDASLDHWRDGLAELVIASLSQSKFIRVIPGGEIYANLKKLGLADARRYTSDDINRVAAQSRATHALSGSFIKPGGTFVITAALQKPGTSESPMTILLEAKGEKDIFPKVDELTRRVMAGLDFTAAQIAGDLQKEAGRITTPSPEALKYYVEGQSHLYKYEGDQARACFEKAVAIDPEFGMAYRALSQMCEVDRNIAEARRFLNRARGLSGRLPENERLLMEGQAFYWSGDYPKAIAAFEKLLKVYPDDSEGHRLLGWVYESVEDIDKFIEQYEAFYRINKTATSVWGLGLYYSLKGWYPKAEDLARSFIREVGDHYRVRDLLNRVYLCRGQFDRARAELEKARLLNPGAIVPADFGWICALQDNFLNAVKAVEKDPEPGWYLWHIALARGRFSEAIELARRDLENCEWDLNTRTNVYGALALVLEKAGQSKAALEAIDRAQKETVQSQEPWLLGLLDTGMTSLVLKGKIQAESSSFDEARETADSLRALTEKEFKPKELRWVDYLIGLVEMGRKNFPKAIVSLKKAAESLPFENGICHNPHALLFDALAKAYYESGDLERARAQYEKITRLTTGRLTHGEIYARSYYRLGKIAERKGDKITAREHYRKFLALWKDADAELPEVEDAGRRLAGLGGF